MDPVDRGQQVKSSYGQCGGVDLGSIWGRFGLTLGSLLGRTPKIQALRCLVPRLGLSRAQSWCRTTQRSSSGCTASASAAAASPHSADVNQAARPGCWPPPQIGAEQAAFRSILYFVGGGAAPRSESGVDSARPEGKRDHYHRRAKESSAGDEARIQMNHMLVVAEGDCRGRATSEAKVLTLVMNLAATIDDFRVTIEGAREDDRNVSGRLQRQHRRRQKGGH